MIVWDYLHLLHKFVFPIVSHCPNYYKVNKCDAQHRHVFPFLFLCGEAIVLMVGGLCVEDQHIGFNEMLILLHVIYFLQAGTKMTPNNENQE
jgi:hypothetical protein